jgi:glutathione synthase/RimK-type ligase-like ATP-grasp enzyme
MSIIISKQKGIIAIKGGKFIPMIRSRHPSHAGLRRALPKLPFRSVIRLGSLTALDEDLSGKSRRVELNSPEAIRNSSSKLKMKQCFSREGVKTAEWISSTSESDIINWLKEYPIVAKSHMGSRGRGNTLLKTESEVRAFVRSKDLSHYIFEKYYNYNKEYRLHVSADGCFYACRKMLQNEFKDHPNAWQRHDDNCVWILETNPNFDKPTNWANIVDHCVKALVSCGLDFGACDLRVQNNNDKDGVRRPHPDFIVVEINSAPSFGEVTLQKYKEVLPQLLFKKYESKGN